MKIVNHYFFQHIVKLNTEYTYIKNYNILWHVLIKSYKSPFHRMSNLIISILITCVIISNMYMNGSSSAQSCFVVLYICYSYSALLVIKSSLCGHGCPHSSVFLDLRTDLAVNRRYVCQLDTHRRRAWHQGFVI